MAEAGVLRHGMRVLWERVRERYQAYELLEPGDPSFICQPQTCDAHCCRRFTVALGEAETERMARSSGFVPLEFLESSDGEPVRLPLSQPFVLARRDNHCALLGDDLGCSQYHGRPDACRLYPHQVAWFDATSARPVHSERQALLAAVDSLIDGADSEISPLLLRHVECPGFTGPPLAEHEWRVLFRETAALQLQHNG